MKKLNLAEASAFLGELMEDPEGDTAVLMRGKKPIAVIFPVGDADLETVSVSFSPKFQAIMERSRRSELYEGTISHEEICREFGLPLPGERGKNGSTRTAKSKGRKPATKVRKARPRS